MSKSWAASLMIGVFVSAGLLALYQATGLFFKGMVITDAFTRRFLVLPSDPLTFHVPLQYAYYTVLAFASAIVGAQVRGLMARIAFICAAVFLTLTMSGAMALNGWLFEPFSGIAATILAGICGMLYGFTDEGRNVQEMADWLDGRLSAQEFNKVVATKEPFEVEAKREMTVLICRVLNHAELGVDLPPGECEVLISDFLREASSFAIEQGGYLDACNNEGVRALFGLAVGDEQHAVNACRAALAMEKHLKDFVARSQKKLRFGIGMCTGALCTGMYDFGGTIQYSAVGEPIDFSRRLSSLNYIYGSHVLLSARTYHVVKDLVEARPMEMVSNVRLQVSEVYELLAEKGQLTEDQAKARDAFWQGVVSLRKGSYKEAVGHLKRAHMEGVEDVPLKYFLDRAEAGALDAKSGEPKATGKHVRVVNA
jgi:class 3 adenylate cyclase